MVTGLRVTELMTNSLSENTNKKLSIQVRLDGLSFFTQDIDSGQVLHYENHTFENTVDALGLTQEVSNLYASNTVLQQSYKKVGVTYVNSLFTFVPKAVFNEDFLADYLKFNTKILATDYIAYDVLERQDMVCVYVPYTNCNNLFFDYYGSFEYHHSMTLFVEQALKLATKKEDLPRLVVNVHHSCFELVAHQNNSVLLTNCFDFTTKEDFIYYLLFTIEQLELDPDKIAVSLVGEISKESALYDIAYTYIRNVSIENTAIPPITATDYTATTLL